MKDLKEREIRLPAQSYWVKLRCEIDGCDGFATHTGRGFSGMVTTYQHKCSKCDNETAVYDTYYPRMEHIAVTE